MDVLVFWGGTAALVVTELFLLRLARRRIKRAIGAMDGD